MGRRSSGNHEERRGSRGGEGVAAGPARVRAARMKDAEAIVALWRVMMDAHRQLDPRFRLRRDAENLFREDLRQRITDPLYCVRVAEAEGRVVGYAIGTERQNPPVLDVRRVGYIHEICVEPGLRRRGVGRALVEALLEWTRGRGLGVVLLRAADRNLHSLAFWRSLGWDAWTQEMWLELPPTRRG